ncbi:uncharacterized protein LOC126803582 [Argentina anserina]|uniref:uncharacterized protein LOC126803582 n=1 Tax=Argentina anserina TaxID=57926 RepID=UPI0021767398|nr:uncharacterized protein LOC126803582 [Potentilla anserina]
MCSLSAVLKKSNENVFGNLFQRKKNLLARIVGIQKACDRFSNNFLVNLEAELIHEYEQILNQKNLFWRQKSRDCWFIIGNLFHDLEQEDRNKLSNLISLLAVNDALFSISPLKAPGYDGFPANFYQHHCQLYSGDIYSICNAFISGCIPSSLNHTIISLISKLMVLNTWLISGQLEMLFKFKKSKGIISFLAWKVNLSKTYDRLSWSFIEKAQRGIRQGDPLSPYFFVMCMKKLSHLIKSVVDSGSSKAVKVSQSGSRISHIFFADDLMLFAEASSRHAYVLKGILDTFCSLSGQTVSYEKSLIFCSPNTDRRLANDISRTYGSPLTADLGKYLGMSLVHCRINKHTSDGLFDKAQGRLASSKSKTRSLAGRLTLIQSVTSAIPIYRMQTTRFLIKFCEKMDKLNQDFLWGNTEAKKKVHLVNWNIVCQPKSIEGLGIKKTSEMNQAMLAKFGKVFSHGAHLFKKNLKLRVRNGKKITFWHVVWLLNYVLSSYVVLQIVNVPTGFCDDVADRLIWGPTSTYNSFFEINDAQNPLWRFVWQKYTAASLSQKTSNSSSTM